MNNRKKIFAILLTIIILIFGIAAIWIATRVSVKEPVAPTAPESKPEAAGGFTSETCRFTFSVITPQTCTEQGQFTVTDQGSSTRVRVTASIGYTDVELRVTRTNGTTANVQSPTVSGSYVWEWSNVPISLSQISQIRFFIGVTAQNPGGIACGTWVPESAPTATPTPTITNTPTPSPTGTLTPTTSPTPTLSPTPSPTDTPLICNKTCGNNTQCPENTICYEGYCRNPGCPDKENCTCDDAALVCNKTCGNNEQCPSGTFCNSEGYCRNPVCPNEADCVCPVVTRTQITATPTGVRALTPQTSETTPTAVPLPDAGISLPGLVIFGGGLLMAIIGILLAL